MYPEPALLGRWSDRNPLNVPGRFYGALTDSCGLGPDLAPRHVLVDDRGHEFVFRQPRTPAEVRRVLAAAANDPFGGYAADGDTHWTMDSVRTWWRERARLREFLQRVRATEHDDPTGPAGDALRHLDGDLPAVLRAYAFRLDQGRAPRPGERLPDLG